MGWVVRIEPSASERVLDVAVAVGLSRVCVLVDVDERRRRRRAQGRAGEKRVGLRGRNLWGVKRAQVICLGWRGAHVDVLSGKRMRKVVLCCEEESIGAVFFIRAKQSKEHRWNILESQKITSGLFLDPHAVRVWTVAC